MCSFNLQRRHIAELLSQLPMELDVEKLVSRALAISGGPGPHGEGGADQG